MSEGPKKTTLLHCRLEVIEWVLFYIQATSKGLATPARNWGSLSRLLLPKALSTFERMVDHGSVLSKVPVSQVGAPPVGKSNTCFNYSPELKQQLANTKTPLGSP